MLKRWLYLVGLVLFLIAGTVGQAGEFADGFDAARDFLTQGVTGTGWDGFLDDADNATVDALNASMDRPGSLYIESAGSFWEGAFNPRGPFIYKLVSGDFVATVEVTDFPGMEGSELERTEHADSFIMARVPNLNDAGNGEDFVCIHYFPTWVGNMRRNMDDGTETEGPTTGDNFNAGTWLQLERVGNIFSFRRSFDGQTWEAVGDDIVRDDMDGLTLQIGLAHSMYSAATGYVAFDNFYIEGPDVSPGGIKAFNPSPGVGATDVRRDSGLSWAPAEGVGAHDVYLGTTFEDVNDASRDNPLGVLASQGQTGTTYIPDGLFTYGQTYYWRIDEVNATADATVFKGIVWGFTTEPYAYPLDGSSITATASSVRSDSTGPEKTIDGSGLDENDGHSTTSDHMWLSASGDGDPWIQYEFDEVYILDKMLVWNSNQAAESSVGWGAKDVQVETSLDGTNWTVVEGITELAQAPGDPGAGPTDSLGLGRVLARYVRISITSNWGGIVTQFSLSEVRFFFVPVQAREPMPASGTTGVRPDAVLSWRPGREAAMHDVFVGMDANAVLDGSASSETVGESSLGLVSLDLSLGETYFWKVNEVNDAEDPSTWEGPLWDFTIPDPLVVDDFESYSTNNIAMRPYVTWRDGLLYSNPAPGGPGNDTGAVVGHDIFSQASPYFNGNLMEMSLVHGGSQSLPLYYDNSGNGGNEPYSEMKRTFSPAQDWSGNAIATLTLYFRGVEGNTGQLYVKINDTKVSYTDDPGAISRSLWEQWNIDLASTGANLSNVQSLTVGIENPGSGLVYTDDIVLYRNAPAPVQGTDPGNTGLVASYSMNGSVADGTGSYDGTIVNTITVSYDAGQSGQALVLDGIEDYVDLPIGSLIASLSDVTVAGWVNWSGEGGGWQRIFDFGTGMDMYMFLTPNADASSAVRFAITIDGGGNESIVDGLVFLPTGDWHHVATTIDSSTMTMALYVDGSLVGSGPTAVLPQDLGETTQNWLGQSQYPDPFFNGALDEFLIYDRALSEAEVRYLAGEQ